MNRQQIIDKIQSLLKLQEGTNFENEAEVAANMIDKLCAKYGITMEEATSVQVLDEEFLAFKKMNAAYALILNAVASFYDAKAYIYTSASGDKSLKVIGSEAQQIQTKLYYEYLVDVMKKEADKAYAAEKVISSLTGSSVNRGFKTQFSKAFADTISSRLKEMKKEQNRIHDHADAVKNKLAMVRFNKKTNMKSAYGAGAVAGSSVGSTVSLNRQASGTSNNRALSAAK
jgi:uncharacterized membrane protein